MHAFPCKRLASILVFSSVTVLLTACGSSGNSGATVTPPPTPTYPALTGNWSLSAMSQVTSLTYIMGGYITNTNGAVSGTIHLLNSGCYAITTDVPITGTVSTSGAFTATSSAVATQVITISGTVTSTALTAGTYSITGGCATGDHGTVTGYAAPPYSNIYSGNFISVPSRITIATMIATTQTGPDVDGFYHVTGTATFSGSPCFSSGTISASTIAGSYMAITITTSNGTVNFDGYDTDSTGKTVSGAYSVTGGICSGDYGTGSVTHS